MTQAEEPDFLKEFDEFLENIDKPVPPKPRIEHLKDKISKPPELDRSREVLAQTQSRFHQEELRQLGKPNEKLLRNKRLFGSARPPSAEARQALTRQLALDYAMEATRARQRAEAEHEARLNEFKMGLY